MLKGLRATPGLQQLLVLRGLWVPILRGLRVLAVLGLQVLLGRRVPGGRVPPVRAVL